MSDDSNNNTELAAELTMAWLSNPNTRVAAQDVPAFLKSMHDAVSALNAPVAPSTEQDAPEEYTPAVSVRKSLSSPDHIISLIDGKPYKTLTRHLGTNGLTPAEYRERYGLKADYPMTAPSYSAMRAQMAKRIGLGRKPGQKYAPKTTETAAPKKRGRPAKVAEIAE